MSGWIKFEKDLTTDPRVLRMAKELDRQATWFAPGSDDYDPSNASALPGVTLVCGALVRLWVYADSHAREDDTLDLGMAEVDELVGIPGFAAMMPSDWIRELDERTVELPGFQAHNGTEAKKKATTQKRVERFRRSNATPLQPVTPQALPDQTKTRPDQDQKEITATASPRAPRRKVSRETPPDPEWLLALKLAYPSRAGDVRWAAGRRAINARLAEGHTPDELRAGAERYAAYVRATGSEGTQFVKTAPVFFGPEKSFRDPWTPPATKAERRQDGNVAASLAWLAEQEAADAAH